MKKWLAALMALCMGLTAPALAEALLEAEAVAEEAAEELDAFELPPEGAEAEITPEGADAEPEMPAFSAENGSYGVDLSSRGYGSMNPYAAAGLAGDSAWYCWGRAYEKCGIKLNWNDGDLGAAGKWYKAASAWAKSGREVDYSTGAQPRENAVAVYGDRVAFIERLDGNTAYVTECDAAAGAQAYNEREIDLDAEPPRGYIYLRFAVEEGRCGDGVSWALYNDRALELRGEGPMWDYSDSPWRCVAVDRVIVHGGVTAIGAGAFMGVEMKSVAIADTVTALGRGAFMDCARLKKAALPDGIAEIPPLCFGDCWQLKRIDLPAGLKRIDEDAFWRSGLAEIDLPEGVESIAAGAFTQTPLTALYLPADLTEIDPWAFRECWAIGEIGVSSDNQSFISVDDALYTSDGAVLIYCAPAKEGRFIAAVGLRRVGPNAFGCSALNEIVLPEGVREIDDDAFAMARNLEKLALPASVTDIGTSGMPEGLTVEAVCGSYGHQFCRIEDAGHRAGGAVSGYVVTLDVEPSEEDSAALYVGERLQLRPAGIPSAHYAFGDDDCAPVDGSGLVTALRPGRTRISVSGAGGFSAAVDVTVTDPYTPAEIALDCPDGTLLAMDGTLTLTARLSPDTAWSRLTWRSSDTTVATVDDRGTVNPVGEGATVVTATTANGLSASVRLEVINPYKCREIRLDKSGTVLLDVNETLQLNAELAPPTARTALNWTSSRPRVATVSASGKVTPVGKGVTRITVATANRLSAWVDVKVTDLYTPMRIKLNRSGTVKLRAGEEVTLSATLSPATAVTAFHWTTTDGSVAGGSSKGDCAVIRARAPGVATITVTTDNGKSAKVRVKVVK